MGLLQVLDSTGVSVCAEEKQQLSSCQMYQPTCGQAEAQCPNLLTVRSTPLLCTFVVHV